MASQGTQRASWGREPRGVRSNGPRSACSFATLGCSHGIVDGGPTTATPWSGDMPNHCLCLKPSPRCSIPFPHPHWALRKGAPSNSQPQQCSSLDSCNRMIWLPASAHLARQCTHVFAQMVQPWRLLDLPLMASQAHARGGCPACDMAYPLCQPAAGHSSRGTLRSSKEQPTAASPHNPVPQLMPAMMSASWQGAPWAPVAPAPSKEAIATRNRGNCAHSCMHRTAAGAVHCALRSGHPQNLGCSLDLGGGQPARQVPGTIVTWPIF